MVFWWWSLMMGLAFPYFSLLLFLFLLPFPHHMWEHSKKSKTDASQECLHRELNWPSPRCCSLQSMTTCGTKRLVFSYWCWMMKYSVHDILLSYICYVWNCLAVRWLWKVHFESSVLVIPWRAEEYRFRQVPNEWVIGGPQALYPTHPLSSKTCPPQLTPLQPPSPICISILLLSSVM